eukprot:NODE_1653_length_1341_cov_140.504644_g1370_i0.p1 GENE.NODE_1653_length_1341_cov_140.504644_g1370_i0~~NODE_1653_length_1341_cov_140.504644_g1370_i0.p1  ORF type:complete len:331 (+),score=84.63 NODE_1653_length_1341_cov_140.504644_g1370_i0:214-1206(+)
MSAKAGGGRDAGAAARKPAPPPSGLFNGYLDFGYMLYFGLIAGAYFFPPLQIEKEFYPEPWPFRWMVDHPLIPIYAVSIYVVFVFTGPYFFGIVSRGKDASPGLLGSIAPEFQVWLRTGDTIKRLLALWNLGLAIFSGIGFVRVIPRLVSTYRTLGFWHTVCAPALHSYGLGPCGLWVWLFIMSKFVELGDTFFMIIRGRQVQFLHWYHHVTVLLYCWQSFVTKSSNGAWFTAMNLFVHTLMYWYFFQTAVGKTPGWNVALTILQISQMFIGLYITFSAVSYNHEFEMGAPKCNVDPNNTKAGLMMYFSYFVLFCHFFYKAYLAPKKKKD